MNKVFFGGSRKIVRLNQVVRERTDNIINNEYLIILGDANGADKAMQKYLSEKNYRNVLIFCMNDDCRNNIGKWKTRHIYSDRSKKDFYYYSEKDIQMSIEADFGFMLWDGKSKGSLNNILNLYQSNKKVLVYFSPTKSFYTIKNKKDILKLLKNCDKDSLKKFEQTFKINLLIHPAQQQLNFA